MEISDAALVLIGRTIYDEALSDRQGFRADQIGIEDDEVWAEIYEAIALVAVRAVAPAIRAAAMEEAAKIAEEHSWGRDIDWWRNATKKSVSAETALECAAAIRAAKETA